MIGNEAKILMERCRQDFGYHRPDEVGQNNLCETRQAYLALADHLIQTCPAGRDLSLALTSLKESMMWANSAIALSYPLAK